MKQTIYIWKFWLEECVSREYPSIEMPSLGSKQVHNIYLVIVNASSCLLRADPDEHQPRPGPDDRLKRPDDCRAPTHTIAVPLLQILASLVLCSIERGSLCLRCVIR